MVCYLLSDAAAFTTGADMLITGEFIPTHMIDPFLTAQVAYMQARFAHNTGEVRKPRTVNTDQNSYEIHRVVATNSYDISMFYLNDHCQQL